MSSAPPPEPGLGASAWGFSKGLVQGVWAGAKSVVTGAVDLAKASADGLGQLGSLAKEMKNDPQTREQMWEWLKESAKEAKEFGEYMAEDPAERLKTAKDGVLAAGNRLWEEEKQGYQDAKARGEGAEYLGQGIGRGGFEIGSLFIGVGQASKAGKLTKLTKAEQAMAKAGPELLPCGKIATEAAEGAARAKPAAAKFKPHGWAGEVMEHQVGRDMVDSMVAAGTPREAAIGYAREMLESGVELPQKVPISKGQKLYKLTPNGASGSTPYWATAEELEKLRGLPNSEIGSKLGLPLESLPKDGAPFVIQEIEALSDTDVFVSKIAKTSEGTYETLGGGMQTLVTRRDLFTKPGPATPFR